MKQDKINPQSILLLPNSKFRSNDDPKHVGFIHDSQINCAKEVISDLLVKKTRRNSVILSAKMQSGKTGVTTAICNIIATTPLYRTMGIDKFFFITGMNDTGLKGQTINRVINQVIPANIDNTYIGKKSKKNLSKNKFFVLKNSDLMAFDETSLNNSIIFIDEAHYGSNERNILTKFMNKHKINWKNTNDLIRRNIYVVSVSATPFDEIYSDRAECKEIIELKPGEGYVGVSELLKSNSIYPASSEDIDEDGAIFDYIEDAHDRMIDDEVDGVIIIRTTKFNIIKDNQYVRDNFDIFEMYASGKKIEYDKFNSKLSEIVSRNTINKQLIKSNSVVDIPKINGRPLIVLIKGAYRAGITLDAKFKDYIYMVFDYSVKSETTAQALLGRMCGYRNNNAQTHVTKYYLNKQLAEMYGEWEQDMTNKEKLPANGTKKEWIPNDCVQPTAEFGTKPCGNFTIPLDGDECKEILQGAKTKSEKRVNFIIPIVERLFKKHNIDCHYDFFGEAVIAGKNNYAKSTQVKRFDSFSEDSLVFQFQPQRIKGFIKRTGRDYFTHEDLGLSAISVVLDCTIEYYNGVACIGGNRRLLVYHIELGQKALVANRKDMYKKHKDTSLI